MNFYISDAFGFEFLPVLQLLLSQQEVRGVLSDEFDHVVQVHRATQDSGVEECCGDEVGAHVAAGSSVLVVALAVQASHTGDAHRCAAVCHSLAELVDSRGFVSS